VNQQLHGPANNGGAGCVAVSPTGRTVFVIGRSQGRTSYAYVTVAYRSCGRAGLQSAPGDRHRAEDLLIAK